MKPLHKALPAMAIACAALSCKPIPNEHAVSVKHDSTGVVIGNPFEYGISSYMIFPVGSNYSPSIFDDPRIAEDFYAVNGTYNISMSANCGATSTWYDQTANAEYINTNAMFFDIRNILFYEKKTGKSKPLTKDTIHILSFAIHYDFNRPQIFYRVVKKDINNDNMFNAKDPIVLMTSNLLGDSLTQLTPDDEQFTEYFYYKDTQTILIKTNMNSDNDTSFATVAETNFCEVHLSHPEMGREIFSKVLRDSLRVY